MELKTLSRNHKIEQHQHTERAGRVERINLWSRAIYPAVLLLVLAFSFEL